MLRKPLAPPDANGTRACSIFGRHATPHRYREPLAQPKGPTVWLGLLAEGCLTMTYFRTGNLHYHRRAAVSRSCSRWEGVVPAGCGRQALNSGERTTLATEASVHRKGRSKA